MYVGNKIKKNVVLEVIKWFTVALLLMLLVAVNYMNRYNDSDVINIAIFIGMFVVMCIVLTTNLGRLMIMFGKEAYFELKKVVWPTYQDSLNTTLVVIAMTVVISLMLWGLDTILVHLISFGLRL